MAKRSPLREQQAELEPTIRAAWPPGSPCPPEFGVTASTCTSPMDLTTQFGGSVRLAPEVNRHSRPSRHAGQHRAQRRLSPLPDRISFQVKPTLPSMDPAREVRDSPSRIRPHWPWR